MTFDRRLRHKVEALRLAGLEYVDRRRFEPPAPAAVRVTESRSDRTEKAESDGESVDPMAARKPRSESARIAQLEVLSQEVAACTKCAELVESRSRTVFSDGSPKAEICFVGEAPGADEDRQGVPFVGRAGQLLTRIIEGCGLRRDEVYICNVLKCRPPENRNPTPDEIENCRPFLERQLELVKPKMLVALGKYATADLLGERPENVPITRLRGQVREYCGIPFMITLHPAYLLRNAAAKRDVWEDMKEVMRRLGRPID